MTGNVFEAVMKARRLFEIEDFPGDFFALLEQCNYMEKYKLLLFKEDIDKLSGKIKIWENANLLLLQNVLEINI